MPTYTKEQSRYIKSFQEAMESSVMKQTETRFHASNSAPGSGKTFTLLESFLHFEKHCPELVDTMLDKGEKILLIVFNKKNKDEIEKAIKKSSLPVDLFDVKTSHSFLLGCMKSIKEANKEMKGVEDFQIVHSRSSFSKNMIAFVLQSLTKGSYFEDEEVEKKLSRKRIFDEDFVSENNINIAWSMVNAYFSTTLGLTKKERLEEIGAWFGKEPVSIDDFDIDEALVSKLNNLIKQRKKPTTPQQLVFQMIVGRVIELAGTKKVDMQKIEHEEVYSFPVVIETNDGEEIKEESVFTHTVHRNSLKVETSHIFKVPHNFYMKMSYNLILNNPEYLKIAMSKYKIMLADEFQDHDWSFMEFILSISKHNIFNDVFMVGDSDQSIYAFKSPDHFDSLSYVLENKENLLEKNINVVRYDFNQTFRFGKELASFVNHFFNTEIIGNPEVADFVSPDVLKAKELATQLKILSEKGTTGIVCKTNQEALDLFMLLKRNGYENVVLESSIKKELNSFVKKGLLFFEDDHTKYKIRNALVPDLGKMSLKEYTYKDILSNHNARKIMSDTGHYKLTTFSIDEIERYIIPRSTRKGGATGIKTAWVAKGETIDYMLISDGFFKKELSGEEEREEIPEVSGSLGEMLSNSLGEGYSHTQKIETSSLQELLNAPSQKQMRNALFVALTRASKGTFFIESPVATEFLNDYPLDKGLNNKRAEQSLSPVGGVGIEEDPSANIIQARDLFT